jgi:hypothetical protein
MERSLNLSILKASFGRHETFALRYSWLTKGFQAFTKNPTVFSSDKTTIDLGVGKKIGSTPSNIGCGRSQCLTIQQ